MSSRLGNLLTEREEIAKALTRRRKKYVEKSIRGKTRSILEEKARLEEEDGWTILRKNKNSFRLKKEKNIDEQLEDEIWTIMATMGFDELSDGRDFKIEIGEGVNPRQIDVFAKDRESAILIECTCSQNLRGRDMSRLIEKVGSLKGKVANSINAHYGKNPKLKIGWVIATRNVEWGNADLKKCEAERITVLRDDEIDYYKKLIDHIKGAAKYQLLSHLFADEEIKGLDLQVPATRGKMGGKVFYLFLVRPSDLMKIAYISHKASRNIEDLTTYQRMLKPKRLRDIAAYIDAAGQFPTNIVVNIKPSKKIRFDLKQTIGDSAFGILYLPNRYASCWIIDGQHRLYGYMQSGRAEKKDDQTTIPVLAYENLQSMQEANLFVDINSKQVKVTRGLLNELYANLTWDSHDWNDKINSLCAQVTIGLGRRISSPIFDRIILTNRDKTKKRCLTLTSFTDGLKENKFFGTERKPGPFWDSSSEELVKTKEKSIEILDGYLKIFSYEIPEQWELGNDKGGFLFTNEGIRALLAVLKDILWYIDFRERIVADTEKPDVILRHMIKYIQPVVNLFKKASKGDISEFRSRQALKGVRKNSLIMMELINREFPEFMPPGLQEHLDTRDVEGTEEARKMIDEIQEKLYICVVSTLKNQFGDDRWWFDRIPEKIRTECASRQQVEKGAKKMEQYLRLINYKDIALHNWELFQGYFSLEEKGGKSARTDWLVRLNAIRNTTHHKEKWPATKDEVRFVREIHRKVMDKFAGMRT